MGVSSGHADVANVGCSYTMSFSLALALDAGPMNKIIAARSFGDRDLFLRRWLARVPLEA